MTSTTVVMVIDDDEDLRETVCEFLEVDGYRTICASDGASALSTLREQSAQPAVILLDLMMPGMNGWQFREEQLRHPLIAHIPVVVMTASRDASGIDANEVVFKPVKLASLLEVVKRYAANDPSGPGGGAGSASETGSPGGEARPARNGVEGSRRPAAPLSPREQPASAAPCHPATRADALPTMPLPAPATTARQMQPARATPAAPAQRQGVARDPSRAAAW